MCHAALNWHHQVETFAARELGPRAVSLVLENLAQAEGLRVERRYFLAGHRTVKTLPNLLTEVAVYLVSLPLQ